MGFYQCTEIVNGVDFDWGCQVDALLVNTYLGNHVGSMEVYFDGDSRATRLFKMADVHGMKDLFYEMQEAIADALCNPYLGNRDRYVDGVPANIIPYEKWGCKYDTRPCRLHFAFETKRGYC